MIKKYLKKLQQLQLSALGTGIIMTIGIRYDDEDGSWLTVWQSLEEWKEVKLKDFQPNQIQFCLYGEEWSSYQQEFDAKIAAIEEFIKKYGGDDRS